MIRQNEVCAGALYAGENFQNDAFFIEPAILGRSFYHGIFAADVVSGHWNTKFVFYPAHDVEIRQSGLDHDHVRAFFEIERDLFQSFARVARIHLIASAIAELWS